MAPSEPLAWGVSPDPDGSSPQTAIPVRSIGEEYDWLVTNLPGSRRLGQALIFFDGKPFDVLHGRRRIERRAARLFRHLTILRS
jgi:hypothetical protein